MLPGSGRRKELVGGLTVGVGEERFVLILLDDLGFKPEAVFANVAFAEVYADCASLFECARQAAMAIGDLWRSLTRNELGLESGGLGKNLVLLAPNQDQRCDCEENLVAVHWISLLLVLLLGREFLELDDAQAELSQLGTGLGPVFFDQSLEMEERPFHLLQMKDELFVRSLPPLHLRDLRLEVVDLLLLSPFALTEELEVSLNILELDCCVLSAELQG